MTGLPTRIGLATAAALSALIVVAAAMWFLGDAFMLWLGSRGFEPAAAAGLTGLAGLTLAGLIGLYARLAMRPRRRTATAAPGGNGIAADLGALVAQQIVNSTREHPYGSMGAALAAGLAVGAIPELRKTLTGLLKN